MRIVDRGDMFGLCGPREPTPARLPLAPLNVGKAELHAHLQRLLGLAHKREAPPTPPPHRTPARQRVIGHPRAAGRP